METHSCPICNSSKVFPYFDTDERVVQCKDCHTVTLARVLWATEEAPDYYVDASNYVASAQNNTHLEEARKGAYDLIGFISTFAKNFPSKTWLDVGAHAGTFVEALRREGYDAEGVEMNAELVESAKARGVPLHQGDATKVLKEKKEKYNVVSAIDVLEHLPDPAEFLCTVQGSIVNEGLLMLEVPNIESFLAKHHGLQWKYIDREHLYYFSPKTITKLLERSGFKVEKTIVYNPLLYSMSIRALSHYFVPRSLKGDRLKRPLKGLGEMPEVEVPAYSFLQRRMRAIIREILIGLIRLLHREDFIVVIARKIS